mgnify:CR=1 FL=1|tara:strand:+ start:165 stop:494 length:330 start_codon:yes stop_codon:yes gene_type:complete
MGRSNGKPYRAIDAFGRIVFFESIAGKKANDVFIATNTKGNEGYYRKRHRTDGPAIIGKNNSRRWYINGVEHTKSIEKSLENIQDPFEPSGKDFQLTKEAKLMLLILSD